MKIFRDSLLAVLVICLLLISGYMPFTAVTDSLAETDVIETKKDQSKDKKVSFNFVDVDISAVVKFISEVTGKNFLYDERVKGTITIIAPSKLSVDDAFNLFTSVLELKGFTIIPSGKIYKIVPISQAKQSGTEIIKEGKALVSDTYIARLIQLKSISSANAMNFLQPLISKDGYISSFGPGNMLMIVDAATNIEKVLEILEAIDKPGVEEPELILIKYANAEDVVKIITEAFKISSKTQQPSGVRIPSAVSVEETKTNVFADTRLNAIVLLADKQEKEAIKRMIALLDVPLPEATSKINVYFLEYADAEELSKVLEGMIVEASIDNLRELGTKWRVTAEKNGEPVAIGGFGTMDAASLQNVIYGLTGLTAGGMGNFLDVPLTTVDSAGEITTETLTIPGFAVLFILNEFK